MAEARYDLLVIGGGINGAGIARDAAMRGMSVCLVEARDYGWATSSKSSRLAHGGLRYLEQFEFGLVHEALQDRERMFRHAPHLVRPMRFLYPIYPEIAARRTVRVGLWLYDLLSHGKSVPGRDHHSRSEALALAPGMEPQHLKGAASYTDGHIRSVERMIAELIWDARKHGAHCHNHTRVIELITEDDPNPERHGRRVTGVRVEGPDGARTIHAGAVVNAAGTWVDDVLSDVSPGKKVRKTKGIHIAVPRFVDVAIIVKARDGRTFFILPMGDDCVIGTTDTDFEGDAGEAVASAEDIRYLQDAARPYFPDAPLDEVRYTWAGVRALVNQEGLTESNVTRRHILFDHEKEESLRGLWSLQGGKITTYRTLAEECLDEIAERIGRTDWSHHPTREALLPGGVADWGTFRAAAVAKAHAGGLTRTQAEHLVDTYGARWVSVLAAGQAAPIVPEAPHLWCEVDHAMQEEQATHLEDVMLRRMDLGIGRPVDVARPVWKYMTTALAWSRSEAEAQWDAYERAMAVFDADPGSAGPSK